ncbi:TPA: DUF2513 domain-containing protein [Yersinia enterocolitica]|nr:DUF2513 domain-containing protein [Yersinia enterocolitica]HDL6613110.1 DUF2513 domain-containing protein [Yersinia enterocolitica]HDL7764270.1 DUF2513 domain-containing protein [Yersinia enterocolitica]HDM8322170.1 DUF2513 domain-containing protein [Yersinia enterocolitica]HDY4928332.1 DUF2513 domain-containing protein [Yersinia enterocolitica]
MQIDFDVIKKITTVFLDSPEPFITLKELNFFDVEGEEENILVFHLLLMVENRLISNRNLETGDPRAIGIRFTNRGVTGTAPPIRLTQDGHDFAKALNQRPILERLKQELTDAPFDLVKDISKTWLTKQIKDRLGLTD